MVVNFFHVKTLIDICLIKFADILFFDSQIKTRNYQIRKFAFRLQTHRRELSESHEHMTNKGHNKHSKPFVSSTSHDSQGKLETSGNAIPKPEPEVIRVNKSKHAT